ncbi:CHAT domain-containing protein [Pseudofrankia saprophytica]|uniref:CHAT domain-containing protein n=1 Tax=Pseudofrankia saprophytica TaxID=298655 RepID=UPI001E47D3BC|nr:CHAT domain-containing protein [Pseudofrankia saprophytica]
MDVTGPNGWRWLLLEPGSGAPLAEHQVTVDHGRWQTRAFAELFHYLDVNADPDDRVRSEQAITGLLGAWAAEELLGSDICEEIAAAVPVTVSVEVPEELSFLPDWPWELASVDGQPLVRHGATFCYEIAAPSVAGRPGRAPRKDPVGDTLRILAVFSQPDGTGTLALRRERHALTGAIQELTGRQGRKIELRILQYGATRALLTETVEEGAGWDLLHLSCHGTVDTVFLETADGRPDPVSTADLIDMLRPSRHRVKLAVLSACQSAAATAAQTLRWLGLPEQAEQLEQAEQAARAERAALLGRPEQARTAVTPLPDDLSRAAAGSTTLAGAGLARALMAALGCAVLAMRYPVGDEFAIRLADRFYDLLLRAGTAVDVATARAIADAAGPAPTLTAPPASLVTPVLLGSAAGLRLSAPTGPVELAATSAKTKDLPAEPPRFVGRGGVLTRAFAALAAGSDRVGVLLHGMAGAGKTACALELAYRQADAFERVVWWSAPQQPDDHLRGLPDFAVALSLQLGLPVANEVVAADRFEAFLPRLAAALAQTGVLVVVDNLESLLGDGGTWRDPRWPRLLAALAPPGGQSRLLLTSRTVPVPAPAGGPGGNGARTWAAAGVLVEPIHALSLAEAAVLARELPGLRALLHADDHEPGAARDHGEARAAGARADRDLVQRALRVVQGHPKLLELADAAARAGRDVLATRVRLAETAAATGARPLAAFFDEGESALGPDGFLTALASWVDVTVAGLSASARLLMELVCGLEDDDRELGIVEANWADVWSRLGRPGEAPALAGVLPELEAGALVAVDRGVGGLSDDSEDGSSVGAGVHPGVAEAVRAVTPVEVRGAVDVELAAFWRQGVAVGLGEGGGGERGWLVVRAGVAAAPYLLRLGELNLAAALLEQAFRRSGGGPGVVGRVLPLLAQIAEATGAPKDQGLYGRVLERVDPVRAEGVLRGALAAAVAAGDHRVAAAASGDLADLLRDRGRLREALAVAEAKVAYTEAGGLGPWTQAGDEGRVLQLRLSLGDAAWALAGAEVLLGRLDVLPDRPGQDDTAQPWGVREVVLHIAASAALDLGSWEQGLDLSARMAASMRARGASEYEIAATCRFADYSPLLRLGRYDEADVLLADCQRIFTDAGDLAILGQTFGARADLAAARGRPDEAVRLEHTALRLKYSRPDPDVVAASHHNLANYLTRTAGSGSEVVAHRLAAALLYHLTGITSTSQTNTMRTLGAALARYPDMTPPDTVAAVAAVVEQVDGVHWADLVDTLTTDRPTADQALHNLITTARALATEPEPGPDLHRYLVEWEPVIAAVATAVTTDRPIPAELDEHLDQLAQTDDWAHLAAALRRVLAGDRVREALAAALDQIDTAILTEILARIAAPGPQGDDQVPAP